MIEAGFIKSVELSDDDLAEYTDLIVSVRPIIQKWCRHIYGENRYRQFRIDYFSGNLRKYRIPKKDQAAIEMLQSAEIPLLQHNVRLITQLAKSYWLRSRHRMATVQFEDFFQEACMAVAECVFAYDGSTKFVTYCHVAINNRLKDFIRVETPLSPASPDIIEQAQSVAETMVRFNLSFDQAVEKLKLPKEQVANCRAAMVMVVSQADIEKPSIGRKMGETRTSLAEIAVAPKTGLPEEYDDLMMQAFLTADLSEIEREVFAAYLDGEHGYQSRIAAERGVTRAAASAAFMRAKAKIRDRYLELAPSEEEALKQAA